MLTISRALSAAQVKSYYRREYSSVADPERASAASRRFAPNSETTGFSVNSTEQKLASEHEFSGAWFGRLAEDFKLSSESSRPAFEHLCDGLHPMTGETLVRAAPVKRYVNRFGKEITTLGHRAGWDLTFSAPKTVSLAAISGGDERLLAAHDRSVRTALGALEQTSLQARLGGNRPAQSTGKMLASLFEHQAARPDRSLRYAAPQLHTHAVTFNLTALEDGRIKPLQPLELYRAQKYGTALYRLELAANLRRLGYGLEIDLRTGAPEISGFSAEYRAASSPRSAEIRAATDTIKQQFAATRGRKLTSDAGIRQIAAWQQRVEKGSDGLADNPARIQAMEARFDFEAQRAHQTVRGNSLAQAFDAHYGAGQALDRAEQQTRAALQLTSAQYAPSIRDFTLTAAEQGIGQTDFAALNTEFTLRQSAGAFDLLLAQPSVTPHISRELNLEIQPGAQTQSKVAEKITLGNDPNARETIRSIPQRGAFEVPSANQESFTGSKSGSRYLEQANSLTPGSDHIASPSDPAKSKIFTMDEIQQTALREVAVQQEAAQGLELLLAL